MTAFRYSALTAEGRKVSGSVEAASRGEATQALRDKGMHVTSMKESSGPSFAIKVSRISGNKADQVYLFTSHMRRLLRARLPLLEALDATAAELQSAPIGQVVARLRTKVAGGSSLAEALAADREYFDDLYISMIRAAQASGTLAAAYDGIYQYEGRRREFKRRLTSALAYPVVLVGVAVLAVTFLMSYVVPRITDTLKSAKVELPTVTKGLIFVSGFAHDYWYVAAALFALVLLTPTLMRRWSGGARTLDEILIKTPGVRRFARAAIVARFSRTFASLVGTGLRVADALEVAGKTSGNILFEKAVSQARSRIVSGGELAGALNESGLFPNYAVQIVGIGERTGTLAESFEEIAKAEEENLETTAARLLTFLEPAIIVMMALVVGFIVASVLLPILQLSNIH